ncbi:glycosyltransferase family 2 protein [Roseicyclus mahoneyensis]|uniref:glycosyltransferase family 2 protein n=1 Tax=Roseicyclus mahoneyensis TaxID=164332 RepID=UPI001B863B3F|nr:glycosyltransferase family A protein [Roseicyclus mahoneyensis]
MARLSVVVVSAGRPRALARCLTALSQLRSTRFEVIVVADADGLAVSCTLPMSDRLTLVPQEVENISAARNAGIAVAAGDVVAFIDDDAVPEPDWAEALLRGFDRPEVGAVTGPVLGRNGISLQWGRMVVDRQGRDRWLEAQASPVHGEVLKLHGTNMAVRRTCLTLTGGFDTGFKFYLDETDLALRLAAAGAQTRYLPAARVHHGFAASARRRADRVPLSLHDIGASSALFLRKHAPDAQETALDLLIADQRARLLRMARARRIGPAEMRSLMESLAAGIAEGRDRRSDVPTCPLAEPHAFVPLNIELPPEMIRRDGWLHRARMLRDQAAVDVAAGRPSALILLEPTPRKHRVEFTEGGWWEQRGGLFGPSDRAGARVQFWCYRSRVAAEWAGFFAA